MAVLCEKELFLFDCHCHSNIRVVEEFDYQQRLFVTMPARIVRYGKVSVTGVIEGTFYNLMSDTRRHRSVLIEYYRAIECLNDRRTGGTKC